MFIYLHFRCLRFNPILSTPSEVWTHAAIHEFADSQFGHLFARGEDREEARKTLVPGRKVDVEGGLMVLEMPGPPGYGFHCQDTFLCQDGCLI